MSLVREGMVRLIKVVKTLPVAILMLALILGVSLPILTVTKPILAQRYSWWSDFNTLDKMRNAGWELYTTDHGSSEAHWFSASHIYSQAGTYAVAVTLHQSDGSSTMKPLTASVGDGRVSGHIYGFTKDNKIIPLDGASIKALKNGEIVKVAYSRNGFYEMYLPIGTYTLIVEHPGYRQESFMIHIESPGDQVELNITLELEFDYSSSSTHLPYPVGGVLTPVSKLAILAPYMALIGLAAVVALAVKKRKH
jgi:hypothetical protein